jgi:hypothetical protein
MTQATATSHGNKRIVATATRPVWYRESNGYQWRWQAGRFLKPDAGCSSFKFRKTSLDTSFENVKLNT